MDNCLVFVLLHISRSDIIVPRKIALSKGVNMTRALMGKEVPQYVEWRFRLKALPGSNSDQPRVQSEGELAANRSTLSEPPKPLPASPVKSRDQFITDLIRGIKSDLEDQLRRHGYNR